MIVIHQSGHHWVVTNDILVLVKNQTTGTVRWGNNLDWIEDDETVRWPSLSEVEEVLKWMTNPTKTGR